jgi:uncharacterized DUF497 family protein
MDVVWDPAKARANLKKHGVRFADAELVLFDPSALTIEDKDSETQQRFVTIGRDATGTVLVVVHAYQDEGIRLLSARRASRKEIHVYEEGI